MRIALSAEYSHSDRDLADGASVGAPRAKVEPGSLGLSRVTAVSGIRSVQRPRTNIGA